MKRVLFSVVLLGLCACAGLPGDPEKAPSGKVYTLGWPESGKQVVLNREELERLGSEEVTSSYFDRAMSYENSSFVAIPLEKILEHYPADGADAVLLNCFDDYQGLISIVDVHRFRLGLATRIRLKPEVTAPGWLNPLLILVPDGTDAPFQERFMTANIRELQFVQLKRYYQPLDKIALAFPETGEGLQVFKDNCAFCHSIREVGGGKGGSLLEKFDFVDQGVKESFIGRFLAFHHKENADKQNVEQFIDRKRLDWIAGFLEKAAIAE